MENRSLFKLSALTITVISTLSSIPFAMAGTESTGFINGSSLNATFINDTRVRSHNDNVAFNHYDRLNYSSYNAILDFKSGYYRNTIGVDLAGYMGGDFYNNSLLNENGQYLANEISFSNNQDWGAGNGPHFKFYTAAIKFKIGDKFNGKAGLIQSTGNGTVGNVWSFVPGTYRGIELNANLSNGGKLTYFWADKYTAPWLLSEDDYVTWADTSWNYLHSIGYSNQRGRLSYNFGVGQATDVRYNGSNKSTNPISYKAYFNYAANDNTTFAADFYGVHDKIKYNGVGYMTGLSLTKLCGQWQWLSQLRYAKSNNGTEVVPRTIYTYGMNNGNWSQFWDALSDWNQSGEVSFYNRLSYDMGNGWNYYLGAGYGTGMESRVVGYRNEFAINGTVGYTVPTGTLKGTMIRLHGTWLTRDETPVKDQTSGKDQTDVRLQVIIPYQFF
jgi:hypothetical protein